MSLLYVGNCGPLNHTFNVIVKDDKGNTTWTPHNVAPHSSICLDLDHAVIDASIKLAEKYGLRATAKDIAPGFLGMRYSIDAPIDASILGSG
jgi:hypothetical protein